MTIANKFTRRMFRRIAGLVWDIQTGQIGVKTENGIYTLTPPETEGGDYGVTVNPFDAFGLDIPAFATQTAHADVALGDLIVGDKGILGWVITKTDAAFKVLDHNGQLKTYVPPKIAIMGQQGTLVVRNLLNLAGGQAGANNLVSSMLPLLALGGGEDKLESVLPFLLMSQQGAAAGTTTAAANPMAGLLPLLLLKKGGLGGGAGLDNPLMLLAMTGGLGGGAGGMNPMMLMALAGEGGLGDLFGQGTTKLSPNVAVGYGTPPLRRV